MAIHIISVKCPDCGASLQAEEGRKQMFCSYCGAKIVINNDNEYYYHHVDDAELKKAEIELKRLELLEKQEAAKERAKKFKIHCSLVLLGIILLAIIVGAIAQNDDVGLPCLISGEICAIILMVMWLNTNSNNEK